MKRSINIVNYREIINSSEESRTKVWRFDDSFIILNRIANFAIEN